MEALVAATVEAHGRLDFLVNVACTYLDNGADTSRADWLTAFNVNLVGSVVLMQAARPHLKAAKGAIVNFGSISSRVAQTGRWVYPVCKAAILQLTRNQAMDLAPDGIRVNAVSPGWTWSNVMDQLSGGNREKTDRVAEAFHLLGRAGDPARWGRRSPSCSRTTPASSPAPISASTAATPPWGRNAPSPPFPFSAAENDNNLSFGDFAMTIEAGSNKRITIVGGGQSGLQLGIGLIDNGYEVEVVQNSTAEEIAAGRVLSSQCMFDRR